MKDKLAIVGCATETRDNVDYDDPDLDIWVLNESATKDWCKRADAVLQMHQESVWKSPVNRGDKKHGEWLMSGNTPPVYMLEKYPEVPNSIKFPKDEIVEELLGHLTVDSERGRKDYFTSTISYAYALAIYLGYKEIHTYGIELADEDEYRNQMPSAMLWTGIALGRGIKWVSHSHMFDAPLYPLETFVGLDKQLFGKKVIELKPKRDLAQQIYLQKKDSCLKAVKLFEDTAAHKDEMEQAIRDLGEAAAHFGLIDGAMQENDQYFKRASAMEEMTSTYVFSTHEFARDQAQIGMSREKMRIDFKNLAVQGQRIINRIAEKEKRFDSERRKLFDTLRGFIDDYVKLSTQIGMFSGAIAECDIFMAELEKNKKELWQSQMGTQH